MIDQDHHGTNGSLHDGLRFICVCGLTNKHAVIHIGTDIARLSYTRTSMREAKRNAVRCSDPLPERGYWKGFFRLFVHYSKLNESTEDTIRMTMAGAPK